jgi:hypothetical protein
MTRSGCPCGRPEKVVPGPEPPDELAHGHRRAALLRVPAALHWLIHHQTVVPGKSEDLLDEVGLLERDKGKIAMRHYDNRTESPYGKPKDHLITIWRRSCQCQESLFSAQRDPWEGMLFNKRSPRSTMLQSWFAHQPSFPLRSSTGCRSTNAT